MDELFGFKNDVGDDEEVREQSTERTALLDTRPGVGGRKKSTVEQILANEHDRRKLSLN